MKQSFSQAAYLMDQISVAKLSKKIRKNLKGSSKALAEL